MITYENRLQVTTHRDRKVQRRFQVALTDYAARYALKLPDHLAIVKLDRQFQVVPIRGREVYDYGEVVLIAAYNINPAFGSPHEAWEQFMEQKK